MPILGKRNFSKEEGSNPPSLTNVNTEFTKEEIAFIAGKLNAGIYQGTEFGLYYSIMTKLKSLLDKK